MTASTSPQPNLRWLSWTRQWGFQTATDGSRFYMRESAGSIVAGVVFGLVMIVGLGGSGVWAVVTQSETSGKVFGGFAILLAAMFAFLLYLSAKRGRWMIVYDRGEPGRPGEIVCLDKRISVNLVKCLSTRHGGGSTSMPQRIVVAELHDGTYRTIGPSGVSTWPDHWGQQAATWMGLPFRVTRE